MAEPGSQRAVAQAGMPTLAGPLPAFAADWQDRVAAVVVAGVDDAGLLAQMIEAGFDPTFARHAITVVRALAERAQEQNPSMVLGYRSDPTRLSASARVRAADREVGLPLRLVDPNLALVEGLLSDVECDKLIQLSRGKLRASKVVDSHTGRLEESGVRRSEGTYFGYGENAVIQRLEARIAALTGMPVSHGEPLQILHYPVGGEYVPHHDYFDPSNPGAAVVLKTGGQRVATLVMYLNMPESGGETVFPEIELTVHPRKGAGVYFEYRNTAGELDARLLHAGAPVTRGDKWIATKWFRERPYHA